MTSALKPTPSMFSLPKPAPIQQVPDDAAEAFIATEEPAIHVQAAREATRKTVRKAAPPESAKAPEPAPVTALAPLPVAADREPIGGARLSFDVHPETLKKVKRRALDHNMTVRQLMRALLEREGLL